MAKIIYEVKDLGRAKWCGEVVAQSDHPEHVEAALLRAVKPHLMSRDIDLDGDVESGTIIVGGFRQVGAYKRKDRGSMSYPFPDAVVRSESKGTAVDGGPLP